jgi:hypothetical protein
MWENRRRDKVGILEDYEHAYDDDLTDIKVMSVDRLIENILTSSQNPQFRYQL